MEVTTQSTERVFNADEWVAEADNGGTVFLRVDQLELDETGRPVILSDLGISSTVETILGDRKWDPRFPAYACRRAVSEPAAENPGPVATMINGNHRLAAIKRDGVELPEGIPVRLGPPLATEDQKFLVASRLNGEDETFRSYTVAERLLSIDSTFACLTAGGVRPTAPALRKTQMRRGATEGSTRFIDGWFTVWFALFVRAAYRTTGAAHPDRRNELRQRLREMSDQLISGSVKWGHLRVKQGLPFEERLSHLDRLIARYKNAARAEQTNEAKADEADLRLEKLAASQEASEAAAGNSPQPIPAADESPRRSSRATTPTAQPSVQPTPAGNRRRKAGAHPGRSRKRVRQADASLATTETDSQSGSSDVDHDTLPTLAPRKTTSLWGVRQPWLTSCLSTVPFQDRLSHQWLAPPRPRRRT